MLSPRGLEGAPVATPPRPRTRKRGLFSRLMRPRLLGCAGVLLFALLAGGAIYLFVLSREISATFEGRLWASA